MTTQGTCSCSRAGWSPFSCPAGRASPPTGYVNDFAAVLAEADEAYLEGFLQALEGETSAEVAVVTLESLEGMTIEAYANRLFAEWGIGQKQKDNGVLLLVAPYEHVHVVQRRSRHRHRL